MIFYKDSMLRFDSYLDPAAFAKARFSEHLDEEGLKCELKDGSWTFKPWSFSGTVEQNGRVFLEGPAFKGDMLLSFIKNADDEHLAVFLSKTVSFYEELIKSKNEKTCIHPYQIFCDENFKNVIIVPTLFFKTAYACLDEAQKRFFVQPNLTGANALRFTQSIFAYYALTKTFPFMAQNEQDIAQDIRDANFKKLALTVYGLTPEVSRAVDEALSQNPLDSKKLKELLQKKFPLEEFNMECGLKKDGTLFNEGLKKVERHSVITKEQFLKKSQKAFYSKDKTVRAKRFVRRHSTLLTALAVFIAIISFFSYSFYSSYLQKPSTRGLTSRQAAAYYYSSVNSLNTDGVQYSSYGPQMVDREKIISNIYVTTRSNAGYDLSSSTKDFAQWLFFNQKNFLIFGLSRFTINGTPESFYTTTKTRGQKIPPLTSEDGDALYEGKRVNYDVHFYLVNDAITPNLTATEYTDKVELTFTDGAWVVTYIESYDVETLIDKEKFFSDYSQALAQTGSDLFAAAEILRETYPFIPTDDELHEAAAILQKELKWK